MKSLTIDELRGLLRTMTKQRDDFYFSIRALTFQIAHIETEILRFSDELDCREEINHIDFPYLENREKKNE